MEKHLQCDIHITNIISYIQALPQKQNYIQALIKIKLTHKVIK
jgi:hypothetical protein